MRCVIFDHMQRLSCHHLTLACKSSPHFPSRLQRLLLLLQSFLLISLIHEFSRFSNLLLLRESGGRFLFPASSSIEQLFSFCLSLSTEAGVSGSRVEAGRWRRGDDDGSS